MIRYLFLAIFLYSVSAEALDSSKIEALYDEIYQKNYDCTKSKTVMDLAPVKIEDRLNCTITMKSSGEKESGYIVMKSISSVIPKEADHYSITAIENKFGGLWLFNYKKH